MSCFNNFSGFSSSIGIFLTASILMYMIVVVCLQLTFTFLVLPCLLLGYLGQAAYLMDNHGGAELIFFSSIPSKLHLSVSMYHQGLCEGTSLQFADYVSVMFCQIFDYYVVLGSANPASRLGLSYMLTMLLEQWILRC